MFDEVFQDVEFPRRHFDRRAGLRHLELFEIDRNRAEAELFGSFAVAVGATQQGFDARHQLHEAERLRHIIVRPDLQPDDLVDLLAARGEHDDRRGGASGSELFADVEPAHLRKHHVQDDQVQVLLRSQAQPGGAVTRDLHRIAFVLEAVAQRYGHRLIVFDNQNFSAHSLFSAVNWTGFCELSRIPKNPANPVHLRFQFTASPPTFRSWLSTWPSSFTSGLTRALWSTGMWIMNALPRPGSLSTVTRPWWASTMCLTIDSPNPLPFTSCTRQLPTR